MSPDTSRRLVVRHPRIGGGIAAIVSLVAVLALGLAGGAASAPPNDAFANAEQIHGVPATIQGTTKGAGLGEGEPAPTCLSTKGVVWYVVDAPRTGAMVARVTTQDRASAGLAIDRVVRSKHFESACGVTDADGRAAVSWYAHEGRSYLIGVARAAAAKATDFELVVLAAEPAPRPPGDPLPAAGALSTVDPILDTADAYAMQMTRGTSYGISLSAPSCISLLIYRPHVSSFATARPVKTVECGGYVAFTPGIDGGGTYSLVVEAVGTKPVERGYRLEATAFGPDDGMPGIALESGESASGSISGRSTDVVDLYRIPVPRENELATVELQQKPTVGLDLVLLTEAGDQVSCACRGRGRQVLREHLAPGHYFVAVRSRAKSSGDYRLLVRIRDETTTTISVGGATTAAVTPGRPVPLAVNVTHASHGGVVQVAIDRLEPLLGWQFSTVQTGTASSSGSLTVYWTPPSVGIWRARARFLGTPYSSFSTSGYVQVHVSEPLV